ncbi:hypothetical protein PMAYCL1PPCAC_15308, partial [Pristionchus mayeri]
MIQKLQREELRWISEFATSVMVYGDIGNCGLYKYESYVVIFSIAVSAPIRFFLVATTVRFLRRKTVTSSNTMRMKRTISAVLVKQTLCAAIFYIYPLLLNAIVFHFQIAFLPEFLLVASRITVMFSYMLNSSAQFIIIITANRSFRRVRPHLYRISSTVTTHVFKTNSPLII